MLQGPGLPLQRLNWLRFFGAKCQMPNAEIAGQFGRKAGAIERLLTGKYKRAKKIILVCDNLNTHTMGAFYEALQPAKARSLVKRIDFRHTPKHGSWLNAAENELSLLTTQFVARRRFPTIAKLKSETTAWSQRSNDKQKGVDWQFQIKNARAKLKSLPPKIKT